MTSQNDPVDFALRVLRDSGWNSPEHRALLKEKLMKDHATHRIAAVRRRRLIAVGVGVLALGGLGFAAAEQFGWMPTSVIAVIDGQTVESELVPDEQGRAVVKFDTPDGPAYYEFQLPPDDGQYRAVIDTTGDVLLVPQDPDASAGEALDGEWITDIRPPSGPHDCDSPN